MKNLRLLFTLLFVAAFASLSFGQNITNSAHDFRDGIGGVETWNASGEICLPCHAPHNNQNTDGTLLWNHDLATNGSYNPYESPTMDAYAIGAGPATVTGSSVLCLSCHDGTVSLEQFGNNPGTAVPAVMGDIRAGADFGTDLSNDHPISFLYADGGDGLALPTATAGTGTIASELLYGGTEVQCSSCHDVHDAYGNANLLKIDNAASALCLTCHIK